MWGGVLLFLPQLVLALPGLVLLPFALWRARRLTWLLIAALLLIAGPLMGFSWSFPERSEGVPLRVMTYNIQLWQRRNAPAILNEILAADPDVLCLQDARDVKNTRLSSYLEHRNVAMFGQYVFVSKFPIVDATVGDISYDGETHTYLRARIDVAGTEVVVFNAHLVTPRDALSPLRSPALWRLGLSGNAAEPVAAPAPGPPAARRFARHHRAAHHCRRSECAAGVARHADADRPWVDRCVQRRGARLRLYVRPHTAGRASVPAARSHSRKPTI